MDKKRTYRNLAVPLFIALLGAFLLSTLFSDYLKQMMIGFLGSLTPIIVGMLVVFLLKHLIDFIERTLLKKTFENSKHKFIFKRAISITISFIIFFAALFLILYILIPRIVEIVTELVTNSALYVDKIKTETIEFINKIIPIDSYVDFEDVFNSFMTYIGETFNDFLPKLLDISTNTLLYIGEVLLGFFIAFLYLIDKEKIHNFFSRMFKAYLNENSNKTLSRIFKKSDRIVLDYVVAKLIEAVVITLVMGITLMLLKVPYAFELAFIMSVLNFIPYIGFILSLLPIVIISIIFGSVNLAITVIIVNVIVFTLLTTFVTPFIIGSKVKTNVLLMLVMLLIFGGLFGIIGMAIAPPIAAIISVIITENIASREEIKKQEQLLEEEEKKELREQKNKENNEMLATLFKNYGSDDAKRYNIFDLLRATNRVNEDNKEYASNEVQLSIQTNTKADISTLSTNTKRKEKQERLFTHPVIKQHEKDNKNN